ncbi:MAG: hypothetical protein QOH71_203 [Blastocatellia bacterium]|jgi:hypothetical protein|nr:hypothetical protein [Blastocatellia bacterium]
MGRKFIFRPPKSQGAKSKSERPSEPPEPTPAPSDKTDVQKATDAANAALTERLEQSPEVQKAIADDRQQNTPVGFKYIEIGSADKNERDTNWRYNETKAPQAYRTPIDMLKAAAIAEAAEEARQEVRKRYRDAERRERQPLVEKMLDQNDLRRREKLLERENENDSGEPHVNRIGRVVAGGLFAVFMGSLIQAFTLFGVITMNSGHIFMVIAFVAGILMITTELLPLKPTRHKVAAIVILGVVLGIIDAAALYFHKGDAPAVVSSPLPAATPLSFIPSEPKTSYEYFRSDDFDLVTMRNTGAVSVEKETVVIERKLIVDLNGKSEFLVFYIPPDRTYDVCSALLDQYPQVIKFFHKNIALQAGTLGSRATDLNELAFTGRIFFYYDGLLFQSKLDLLVSKAARKHLSLQFRGPDYVMVRNGFVRAPDKSPPPLVSSPNIDMTLPKPGSRGTGP